jgi:hypothetical protein
MVLIPTAPASAQEVFRITSKYGNPLDIGYSVEVSSEPDDDGLYRHRVSFWSRTTYEGVQHKCWVGGDILWNDSSEAEGAKKTTFNGTLRWDKPYGRTFRAPTQLKRPTFAFRGWVGSYLTVVDAKDADDPCKQLVAYRDNELFQTLEKAMRSYEINAEAMTDLRELRADLEDDVAWAQSDLIAVLKAVETGSNLILKTTAILSPAGKLADAVKEYASSPKQLDLLKDIQKGKRHLSRAISEDVVRTVVRQGIAEFGKVGAAADAVLTFAEDLKDFTDLAELRSEYSSQLTAFDKAIVAYQAKTATALDKASAVVRYKNYIDEYLKETCGQ